MRIEAKVCIACERIAAAIGGDVGIGFDKQLQRTLTRHQVAADTDVEAGRHHLVRFYRDVVMRLTENLLLALCQVKAPGRIGSSDVLRHQAKAPAAIAALQACIQPPRHWP